MQYKDSLNYPRLISPEVTLGCMYRWLRQAKAGSRTICLILLLGLLLMTVSSANAGPPSPGDGHPPLVTVVAVIEQDVNPPAEYVGHVEAIQTVDLRARVEGFLEKVNFKEGSDVQAGDLLYIIEQAPYQSRVDAAGAIVAQAEASLSKAGQRLLRLRTARAESVPATDMDNAVAEELSARAQLAEAKANLAITQINFGYTQIKAPICGRIGRTAYTKGNLVNPASGTLARIVQLDPIRVVYSISENDIVDIQMALRDAQNGKKNSFLTSRLKLANGETIKGSGRMDFVNNAVDPGTGTIVVRALFDNPDGMLLPGQYVTVMVTRSKPKLMPVVPQSAILEDHDGRYVFVVDDQNRVIMRRVKTGPVIGVNWAMASGLTVGEKVIVEGIQKVQPGQVVKTVILKEQNGR
ncbi:MAG: efflux RND transporter periplasmic adaptor subunit [Thermodesulfobacteriota bacterium]|nr:efflux RND transporter periplasmic adaptor subunit [Thermodesulfobacteriota bacterium]